MQNLLDTFPKHMAVYCKAGHSRVFLEAAIFLGGRACRIKLQLLTWIDPPSFVEALQDGHLCRVVLPQLEMLFRIAANQTQPDSAKSTKQAMQEVAFQV